MNQYETIGDGIMDDAKYLFLSDSKEKKDISRSARKKVTHTGCTLPSDYLSAKQKRKLNGEVFSVNIKKPMKYAAFKLLSRDIQQQYLDFVASEFSCSQRDFAVDILGVHDDTLHRYIIKVGLHSPWIRGRHLKLQKNKWAKFIAGQYASESDEKAHSEANNISHVDTLGDAANTQEPAVGPEKAIADCWADAGKTFYEEQLAMAKKRAEELQLRLNKLTSELGTAYPQIEMGRFVPAQVSCTIDEAVTEQPYTTRSFMVELRNVRNWNDIVRAASAFSLPESNIVLIQVTEDYSYGDCVGAGEMNHEEV